MDPEVHGRERVISMLGARVFLCCLCVCLFSIPLDFRAFFLPLFFLGIWELFFASFHVCSCVHVLEAVGYFGTALRPRSKMTWFWCVFCY